MSAMNVTYDSITLEERPEIELQINKHIKKINKTKKIMTYDPISQMDEKIIYLNTDKTSYIKINHIPPDLKRLAIINFDSIYKLCPTQKHKIIMYGSEVEVNRYQQCYLETPNHTDEILSRQSYMYSGFNTSNNNLKLPELFQPYYDHMICKDNRYNHVAANWYKDGEDYIAYHSDCEKGMVSDHNISILSLYGDNYNNDNDEESNKQYRVFGIIPKNKNWCNDAEFDKVCVILRHGTIITMGGMTQTEFKHGIEQTERDCYPRVSLSFRQFES